MKDVVASLKAHGIQPSAQRVAVAQYVLGTGDHPSADHVYRRVKKGFPIVSRATVYNTLNLFVEKGLLRAFVLAPGKIVFDPNTDSHHHFIDEVTGEILDVPWAAVSVGRLEHLKGLDVREYQVVMRGRRVSRRG